MEREGSLGEVRKQRTGVGRAQESRVIPETNNNNDTADLDNTDLLTWSSDKS